MAAEPAQNVLDNYNAYIDALMQAGINEDVVNIQPWIDLNNGNLSPQDFNNIINAQGAAESGFRAISNADGSVRSYTYVNRNVNLPNNVDDVLSSFNSNVQSGTSSAAYTTTAQMPTDTALAGEVGSQTVQAAGGISKYTGGTLAGKVTATMGSVMTALMAAGTGIQLGKMIDGGLYNVGNALGLDPPETLNPETWNTITSGDDSLAARAFNFIFGLNPNTKQMTAYADENAFAYMSGWLMKQGFFNGESHYAPPAHKHALLDIDYAYYEASIGTQYQGNSANRWVSVSEANAPVYIGSFLRTDATNRNPDCVLASEQPFKVTTYSGAVNNATRTRVYNASEGIDTYIYVYQFQQKADNETWTPNYVQLPINYYLRSEDWNKTWVAYDMLHGTEQSAVDGVSDQDGAVLPNTSGWDYNDPTNTILPSLQQQYPDLWNNRMENDVVQPDGSIKKYVYIPIEMPSIGEGTNPDTQPDRQNLIDPAVNPNTSTDTKLQTILQTLTSLLPQALTNPANVPQPELQDGSNKKNPNPDIPENPTPTGIGLTPPLTAPSGNASSLWKVYHPSQAQVDAFGAWLWSSNFVEQIKKMFNDPMQSIIGLHKVFAAPIDSGSSTIKVGYLDSGVASAYVDNQYVTVDCGSVKLREYFGNVFDYEPFTRVAIFLPFIGIQKLDVAEVMRSTISVVYHVDVFSGACLAEVSVRRDGGGGCLYTFSGDASARYPISSGSYMGIVSGVLSIAGGIAGTIATGGAALPAVVGAGVAATHMHTDVKHSGQISGNAGAMGGKVPYLIVVRPQTEVAKRSERYYGYGANSYCKVENLSGFSRLYNAVVRPNDSITDEERKEIQTILESGFYA